MTALGVFKEPRIGMLLWSLWGSFNVAPRPYRAQLDYQQNTLPEDTWVQALDESRLQEVFLRSHLASSGNEWLLR
jgi:hypothetical protein